MTWPKDKNQLASKAQGAPGPYKARPQSGAYSAPKGTGNAKPSSLTKDKAGARNIAERPRPFTAGFPKTDPALRNGGN